MKTNWIATVATGALALSLAAGSGAYAQMTDSHRHESGPGGQGPSMSRPEVGHSAAGEQRSLGERTQHAAEPAMREHAETGRPHEMGADGAQAQDRHQPRDTTRTIGQGSDHAGRGERALPTGAAENRSNENHAGREAQQRSESGREQGKTADIKQNKPAETSKSAESGGHGQDVGQGRIGRNKRQPEKLTGQNQQQHGAKTEHAAQGQQERNKQAEQHSPTGSTPTQQQAARPTPGQTTGEARPHDSTGQAQTRDSSRDQAQGRAGEVQGEANARGQMASTKINNNQRTQVLDRLRSNRDLERARSDVNIRVDVGERLPERVRPLPLPPDIVDVVPEYRGYDYTVIHDDVAIINPESREVVDVIPERGFTAASGSYGASYAEGGRIELSHEQREILRRAAVNSATTVGSSGPACLSLRPVPDELARSRPELASDKYLAIGDQVVLVDPHDQKIVEVINSND